MLTKVSGPFSMAQCLHKQWEKSALVSNGNKMIALRLVDDWMGDVEDAIAKALKKEGITPKPVKITARPAEKETKPEPEKKEMKEPKEPKGETSGGGKSGKRRKHKSDKESSRKKAKLAEEEAEAHAPEHKYESEDVDEYEMMNVRGGSPSQHGSQRNVMYYGSGRPSFLRAIRCDVVAIFF